MKIGKVKRKTVLILSFLALVIVFAAIISHMCFSKMTGRVESAKQFVVGEENKMRFAVESRITTAKALEMYVVSQDGDISDFENVAAFYYQDDPAIRSIQLAPDGVVTKEYMYPREEGDFAARDLFADSERKDDAIEARDSGKTILTGPIDLHQGGRAILIRHPIYLYDENGHRDFWGFSIVVFNVPEVFNIEHLNLLTSDRYYYRLWEPAPDPEHAEVIVENTERELKNAVTEKIEIYNAVWYLDIVPQDNWLPREFLILLILVFSVILVLAMMAISSHLRIRDLVYCDQLLDIGNGNYLLAVFERLPRDVLSRMYLVAFDIDRFKEFNYIYGEKSGDELLKYIARVFREELPEIYLFRDFSDYFVALGECESQESFEEKMKRLLYRFSLDIEQGNIQPFDVSAGVRKVEAGEHLRRLISDALIARGTIKGNHLTHYAFYDDEIRNRRVSYMEMESNFQKALRDGEFHVYYQPKFDIRTRKMIGAEALTRWTLDDGTVLSPGLFIPCFEQSRQIILLDEYVLGEVCRQMKEMEADGLEVKPVSVNLSRVHLRHPDIIEKISAIIERSGVDPSKLSFEITESALFEDSIPLKDILHHLHKLGCKVEMDDYGVGASNLDALISNPFDVMKLDKSFVDRIGDKKTEDMIRSLVQLAAEWGVDVLTEGVENPYQADRLLELGCRYAQGFYYAKPMPEEEYRKLL